MTMTDTTITLTPAQLIERGLENLDRLRHLHPHQREYSGVAQAAIADMLAALAITITGQDRPAIPGLPDGWKIEPVQSMTGSRLWAYELASPEGRQYRSSFQWKRPESVLAAGVRRARELTGEDG
jgi:hypothetical protein